jgi:protein-L-isoaspartate O-methyltransferase
VWRGLWCFKKGVVVLANEKQIAYWNDVAGPKWVKIGDAMDARFAGMNEVLLARAAARPGESVLDIGCGTGTTARPLAALVAPGGHVTGIDVSVPMLGVARERGGDVSYLEADAQTHDFGGQKFDLLTSRFGVMFFTDPFAAFRNLHGALAPDGRLCFVCWAPLAENPHWQIPFDIVRGHLGEPEARHPHAPGPLAFSDAGYVEDILAGAGFSEIAVAPTPVRVIGKSLDEEARVACFLGPAGALLDEKHAGADIREVIQAEVAAAIARFRTDDGMSLPATVFVVTALKT